MVEVRKNCLQCGCEFIAKRKDSKFCRRLCYRRHPPTARKYSKRTSEYQKMHSRDPNRRWDKLRHKCTHKNYEFNISKDAYNDLLLKGCEYCGASVMSETGCSLDRIDNALGYTVDNVITCCGACNQIRNLHLSYEEMKVAMKAVIEFRGLK